MLRSFHLIFFSFYIVVLFGQNQNTQSTEIIEEQLYFYLLDVENGLSNNIINSIEQDSLGFIWVGTNEGINRYDGSHFEQYKYGKQSYISISDNFIHEIKLNREGKLFISTEKDLNIYDPKKETVKLLNQTNGLIDGKVNCVVFGNNGELIVGVYSNSGKEQGGGIQIFGVNGNSKVFRHDSQNVNSLSSNKIISITRQNDSILWIGTDDQGLNKLNLINHKITRIPFGKNRTFQSAKINELYVGNQGNLWVGSNQGVQVITKTGDTLTLTDSLIERKGLSDDQVLCFQEDDNGFMWIGTRNGGLNIISINDFIEQKNDIEVRWYLPKNDGSSVHNRTVSALKKDRSGGMWIGTSTGINYVNPVGEPIKILRKSLEKLESIGHDRVSALAENYDKQIWIGTDGAGLDLYNPFNGRFKYYRHNPQDKTTISNDYILSICVDSKKRVWAGTYQGGLNRLDNASENPIFYHYLQGDIKDGSDVRAIFEDSKQRIWVGTNRGGLFVYDETLNQFDFVKSLGKIDIRDIEEDDNGYLWFATYGDGIIKYDPIKDESLFYNSTTLPEFKTDFIYSVLVTGNGDILGGTLHEGLLLMNPTKSLISYFSEDDGLSNNSVTSLLKDSETSIWLGTYKGVSHFNQKTRKLYNLNSYNNIQKGDFAQGASLKSTSGYVYMGGNNGLNIFKPENLFREKKNHSLVIKNLDILGDRASIADENNEGVLMESILYEEDINLKYNQNILSVEYAALKFPFTKNVSYSYRIDNYIDQWINTNDFGGVDIIKIPPGNYNLHLRAKLGSGDEITKSLKINIKPPIWGTTVAYLIYIIGAILLVLAAMRFYSERIKLRNSLLFEKKQRQLEHNFNEERITFFTSFSHELKTPLTLILAPLEDLISEVKSLKHKSSLQLIQKNAVQLLQSINKLLEFRKSNLGLNKLKVNEHNLTEHIEQWVDDYYPLAKKRDIDLSFDSPNGNFYAWIDIEKVHIVFNNILSNAFKYMDDKGEINVSLSYTEDEFEIKVRDTGYGIAPNDLEHIFDRYYRSDSILSKDGIGIGLALAKNLVELHLGTITITSEVSKGSTFSIIIPRDKKLFEKAIVEEDSNTDGLKEDKTAIRNPIVDLEESEKKNPNINIKEEKELLLLVDDNKDILSYMDELLGGKFDLIYAYDGAEALEKALRYIPDLIVSDVMMPKLNGIDLCNALKKSVETTHIPVILLTAKGNPESIEKGYAYGADSYLVKPFSPQVLQSRIRNLLDSRIKLRNYFLDKEEDKSKFDNENSKLLEQEKEFLNKLEKIILENLDNEKFDVWEVSRSMAMSRTSLYRKVKAITGLNINQYITKVKIDKAARLIKTGNYTIAQASYEVGYNNVKYFRKLFKETFGQLPSDMIKGKK